jgi:hypothetical protein
MLAGASSDFTGMSPGVFPSLLYSGEERSCSVCKDLREKVLRHLVTNCEL